MAPPSSAAGLPSLQDMLQGGMGGGGLSQAELQAMRKVMHMLDHYAEHDPEAYQALVNQTARSAGQKELFVEGKLQAPMPAKAASVPATAEVPHIVTTAQVLPVGEDRPGAVLSSTSSSGREQLEAGTSSLLSRLYIYRPGDTAAAVALRIDLQRATPAAPLPRPSVAGGKDVSSATCSWEGLRVPMRLLPQPVKTLLDGRAAQQADLMQLQVECHSSVLSMLQAGQPAGFADLLLQRVLQLVTKERSDLQLDIAGAAWQASGDANAGLIPAKHPVTTAEVSSQAKKRPLIQELS